MLIGLLVWMHLPGVAEVGVIWGRCGRGEGIDKPGPKPWLFCLSVRRAGDAGVGIGGMGFAYMGILDRLCALWYGVFVK